MDQGAVVLTGLHVTPSPDGEQLAALDDGHFIVYDIRSCRRIVRVFLSLQASKVLGLRWAPAIARSSQCAAASRVLVYTKNVLQVIDFTDAWSHLRKVYEFPNPTTPIHATFGANGSEIMVFNYPKLLLINLDDSTLRRVREGVIDGYRFISKGPPSKNYFAALIRAGAADVVAIVAFGSYQVLFEFTPKTVDAAGLKFAPDGQLLAIWETASMGLKILIYTPTGDLLREFRTDCSDNSLPQLGVKSLEWAPNGQSLAVSSHDNVVKLMRLGTFATATQLVHVARVLPEQCEIMVERPARVEKHPNHFYEPIWKPYSPPTSEKGASGVSIMAYNADGTLLATNHNGHPTTVWIWDLEKLKPREVFVQQSVVKNLAFHPHSRYLLLIQCEKAYIWHDHWMDPKICDFPDGQPLSVNWLPVSECAIWARYEDKCRILWPDGHQPISGSVAKENTDVTWDQFANTGKVDFKLKIEASQESVNDTFQFRREKGA